MKDGWTESPTSGSYKTRFCFSTEWRSFLTEEAECEMTREAESVISSSHYVAGARYSHLKRLTCLLHSFHICAYKFNG